jgi:hypothetical protein
LGIAIHSTTARFQWKSLSLQDFIISPDIQGSVILSLRANLGCKQGIHSRRCCVFQVKSQIGHGDLPLKGLGTVKSWSGELDKSQNLRTGYKTYLA